MRDTITLIVVCSMFFTIFTFVLPVETCEASELTVGSGAGYDYSSIQSAIDAANESDTIYVASDTYNENIIIDKSVSLISTSGASSTTINSNSDSQHTIKVIADDVVISGFKVQNILGKSNEFACIFLNSNSGCNINNNIIKNGETGIYLVLSSNNIINQNTIEDNDATGVLLGSQSNSNQLTNNIIQNNIDKGVQFTLSSSNTIYGNTISDNFAYGIYLTANSVNNQLYNNIFSENGINAEDCCSNEWYNGNQGNYWSDYDDYDSNSDGIGDSPYTTGDVNDQKPLGYFLNQKPVAHISSISPNPATVGNTIQFSGYGTDDGNIVEWEWKINSNIVSSAEDFSYSSLSAGTYSIYFRVKDNDGEWSDYTQQTLVINSASSPTPNQKPTAHIQVISPSTAYFGDTVTFNGYGVDEDGTVTKYNWSSSIDGYLPESPSFTVTSLSIGTHNIAFKVRDNEYLWSNTVYRTVTIEQVPITDNQDPIAIINDPDQGYYIDDEITFDASNSYDNDGSIAKYAWDFGDGNTANGQTTTHSYTQDGEYTIVLTITDNYGAQDTETSTVTILSETGSQQNNNNETDDDTNDKWVIPGFEIITFFFVILILLIIKKKRK